MVAVFIYFYLFYDMRIQQADRTCYQRYHAFDVFTGGKCALFRKLVEGVDLIDIILCAIAYVMQCWYNN